MKVYSGEITFGTATDSLDADGEVVATGPLEVVTPDRVSAAAAGMIGPQQQVPPMVSAIKMGGKKLYELARDGVEVERAPRDITISSFSVVPTDDPATYRFSVTCSVGTYVRVIAQDLATSIGTVAHLSALRREGSGTATVSMAMSLDDLAAKIERGDTVLEAPEVLLGDMPAFDVNDETALAITRGQRVAIAMDEPFVAARYNGQLLGVLAQRSTYFQPDVVFPFVVGN
jgi:tRNA pseudouridine55 synthase